MKLTILEDRCNPAPTFDWLCNSSWDIKTNLIAYGAYVGGGPRVEVQLNDQVIFNEFVFPDFARGGVDATLIDVDGDRDMDMMVGAGVGGGPRVKVYENDGDFNFRVVKDYFAYDPHNRDGVYIAPNGAVHLRYRHKIELAIQPASLLSPVAYGGGSTTFVARDISLLPDHIAMLLKDKGLAIEVFDGNSIVQLEEFAHLRNVTTGLEDVSRNYTYDRVGAVSVPGRIIISAGRADAILHELGHQVYFLLTNDQQKLQWTAIHSTVHYQRPYFTDVEEGFAESFAEWVRHEAVNPAVQQYFDNLLRRQ